MTEAERQEKVQALLKSMASGVGFSGLSGRMPSSPSVTPRNPIAEAILGALRSLQEATGIEGKTVGKAARGLQDAAISGLQNLPEPIKKPVRQAVGRVATNVIEPFGYPGKAEELAGGFAPKYIMDTLASIWKDQPSRWVNSTRDEIIEARRPLFREYFDLPTQDTQNMYIKDGKNYRINPATKQVIAGGTLREFQDEAEGKRGDTYKSGFLYSRGRSDADIGPMRGNAISGEYMPGQPDPWNFDLSQREIEVAKGRPLTKSEFGRSLFEAIGRPAILDTRHPNPPPKEEMEPEPVAPSGKPLAGANQMPASMLRQFPPWMRDIMRTTPDYPKAEKKGTHQFDPDLVPIIPGSPAGQMYYEPMLSRDDALMMAQLQPIAQLIHMLAG